MTMRLRIVALWFAVVFAFYLGTEQSRSAGEQNFNGEKLATLKAGNETYSNVTITAVTATDIYFTHSAGMGNAKLKNLDPELQRRFHFDPKIAADVESRQKQAKAIVPVTLSRRPSAKAVSSDPDPYISVQAADESVQFETYDPIYGRPSELSANSPSKIVCTYRFDADFSIQTVSDKAPFKFRIDAVKVSLALPMKVISPSTPVEPLKNYLEGYRQVYEHFYELGPKAAERAARVVGSGSRIPPGGNDVESAKADFIARAKAMAQTEYYKYTWYPALRALKRYNVLTDYSLGLKDAFEAKQEVIQQFEVPIPDN